MKKRLIIIILLIIFSNILYIREAKASSAIYDIEIGEINENNWLNVKWKTRDSSTAYLFFGENPEKLSFSVGHLIMGKNHSADITGLKKNSDYYFKIVSTNEFGQKTESFINYFNTKNLKDNRAPIIYNFKKIQTTDKSFSFSFQSDEDVRVEFRYGLNREKLDKTWRNNSLKSDHQITITGLFPETNYFFELIARDSDNNISTYSDNFKTTRHSINEIKINNLIPSSYGDSPMMPEKALISFNTNLLVNSEIVYGTDPKRLNRREKISSTDSLNHQIFLSKLEANTTYYYKLRLKSPIIRGTYESPVYSFKTSPFSREYLNLHFQNGDLVKHRSTTYLIYNESRLPVYNSNKIKSLSDEVKPIEEKYLNEYKESAAYWGMFHDGQVVKDKNKNTVYLIDGPYKRAIANWQVFSYLNYKASDIVITDSRNLSNYKNGQIINHSKEVISNNNLNNILAKSDQGNTVYLLVNNKKLPFFSEKSFREKGYSFSQIKIFNSPFLDSIPDGQVII